MSRKARRVGGAEGGGVTEVSAEDAAAAHMHGSKATPRCSLGRKVRPVLFQRKATQAGGLSESPEKRREDGKGEKKKVNYNELTSNHNTANYGN